ncbi:cytochrome-c peroxidase [Synoicihabitans lomoniglobus]|uniref:Cytochrome c peroxidase n=1 Tax=Synoicihabitans lomoniglobus TaxID=2909285 RepID=A0AAF0A070_9BACT|nr:c-type cytochrome [Opitutaceae bacterium LMO-M01]WED64783.1 cytochrome c peroxidase [Opitutaceae bacterium LMO-M01]
MARLTSTVAISFAILVCLPLPGKSQRPDYLVYFIAKETFASVPLQAPELENNPATPAKRELGKMLFFDPRLSPDGTSSCHSCHDLTAGGASSKSASFGHHWQKEPRNAPTVFNAIFNTAKFWDGRSADLTARSGHPVEARLELGDDAAVVVARLGSIPGYVRRFAAAFPDDPEPVNHHNMALALECFQATLITSRSRFDRYLDGDVKVLKSNEEAGLRAFTLKGCTICHTGVNLGGDSYYPFGVFEQPPVGIRPEADRGRFAVTASKSDDYVFRASPLRNIALTSPYFHSGQVESLEEAVAIMSSSQMGGTLTDQEVSDIVAFLQTLTGRLPTIESPALPPSPSTPALR